MGAALAAHGAALVRWGGADGDGLYPTPLRCYLLSAKPKPSTAGSVSKGGAAERLSFPDCGEVKDVQLATTRRRPRRPARWILRHHAALRERAFS